MRGLSGPGNLARSESKPGTELSFLGHAHAASAKTWSSTLEIYRSLPALCIPIALRDRGYYAKECTDESAVDVRAILEHTSRDKEASPGYHPCHPWGEQILTLSTDPSPFHQHLTHIPKPIRTVTTQPSQPLTKRSAHSFDCRLHSALTKRLPTPMTSLQVRSECWFQVLKLSCSPGLLMIPCSELCVEPSAASSIRSGTNPRYVM